MADINRQIEVEKLLSYSNDLVQFLNNEKDINHLTHCVEKSDEIRYRCREDDAGVQTSLQDYQKTIDLCMQKAEAAKNEFVSNAEINLLQKELDEELQRGTLLPVELRAIVNQIKDVEDERNFIEDRKQVLKKLERDEMKAWMRLSMFASVTNIIPDLNNQSGYIVNKEKKVVEKFDFSSQDFDTCNAIWKMITH